MIRFELLLLLFLACGETAATTTSSSPTTAAVTATTITTTTTTAAASPTTAAPRSTTTVAPAAEFPLVVSSSGLLGYHDGTHWVPGEALFEVEGGEVYRVVNLDGIAGTATGSSLRVCEPSQTPLIELDPPLPLGHSEPGAIAITGVSWDLVPRSIIAAGGVAQETMAEAVTFLSNRGLDDPEPEVAQHLVVDLEGDGVDEEILVVKRIPDDLIGNADSYSLVLMRKMLDIEEATLIIEFSLGAADNPYVVSHSVSAIVDLNGDDKMEIVVDGYYYEGSGTTAWEYLDDDLGTVMALSAGCGA